MKTARYLAIALAAFGLVACQTVSKGPPPAGTKLYEVTALVPGTKIVRRTISANSDSSRTQVIAEVTEFNGRQAYRVTEGNRTSFYDVGTNNWIATADENGKTLRSASPYRENFRWPLWVGKAWRSKYDFTDHEAGRTWNGVAPYWEVEAVETITVPAGTFETLRIQSGAGQGVGFKETHWYAPEIGLVVKTKRERRASHYRGSGGHRETVLVSVEKPE